MHVSRVVYVEIAITALSLFVVWQAAEVRKAGYRLEELRRGHERCAAKVHSYCAHVEKLKSPQRILHLVEHLGLRLVQPAPNPALALSGNQETEGPPEAAHRSPNERSD